MQPFTSCYSSVTVHASIDFSHSLHRGRSSITNSCCVDKRCSNPNDFLLNSQGFQRCVMLNHREMCMKWQDIFYFGFKVLTQVRYSIDEVLDNVDGEHVWWCWTEKEMFLLKVTKGCIQYMSRKGIKSWSCLPRVQLGFTRYSSRVHADICLWKTGAYFGDNEATTLGWEKGFDLIWLSTILFPCGLKNTADN